MDLRSHSDARLPRLAWLALVDRRGAAVDVVHGEDVEIGERRAVEGVWDGPFDRPGFSSSPHFFGSGLEIVDDEVVFTPSRALVDRLFSCRTASGHAVSNSLVLMLAATGSSLVGGRTYTEESDTILRGIREYEPRFEVAGPAAGSFRQHFHLPFRLDAGRCEPIEPAALEPFADFADYSTRLGGIVGALMDNAASTARRRPLDARMTLSAGYDSPAVAALAARRAKPLAYTSTRSNAALPPWLSRRAAIDDGTPVAEALGLPVRPLHKDFSALDERLWLAGGTAPPEPIFGSMANDILASDRPALVLSGYHGDKVWALDPGREYLGRGVRRGDTSGMPLGEVRLHAGFVHCPVPFIGAAEALSIHRIANGPEMAPWRVGGGYDRPVPRRLAEEAGVPREAFGQRKRAVVETYATPQTAGHRARFDRWLRESERMGLVEYRARARASEASWAAGRVSQAVLSRLGVRRGEPVLWRWLPGAGPGSALHRWAIDSLLADETFGGEARRSLERAGLEVRPA